MIFVTVGSATYKFERLFRILDELCEERIIDGKIIYAQTGITSYTSDYYECVEMIKNEKFYNIIDECDVVICHAGVGTIINALNLGKKIIIFPRLSKYNEHVDNHQLEIMKLFVSSQYVMSATNKEELVECLRNIKKFKPKKFKSSNGKIDDYIINYLEGDSNE